MPMPRPIILLLQESYLCYNPVVTTITIPKNLTSIKNLIAIPFEEYERLLSTAFLNKEIDLTLSQKKRLQSARRNLSAGKTIMPKELGRKMGNITEKNILRWSREAKVLKKAGRLTVLSSLKELR